MLQPRVIPRIILSSPIDLFRSHLSTWHFIVWHYCCSQDTWKFFQTMLLSRSDFDFLATQLHLSSEEDWGKEAIVVVAMVVFINFVIVFNFSWSFWLFWSLCFAWLFCLNWAANAVVGTGANIGETGASVGTGAVVGSGDREKGQYWVLMQFFTV
jgi:hypothetical protein